MGKKINKVQYVQAYLEEIQNNILCDGLLSTIDRAKKLILENRKKGTKIILIGNGASNLITSHAAMDLANQLGVKAYSVNDGSFITAAANDFGYENIFERYLNLYAGKGDLLICISSSGKSKNIINAAILAKKIKCKIITFTGFEKTNALNGLGDVNFWVNSKNYNVVESVHNSWITALCESMMNDEKHKIGIHGIEF